MYQAVERGVKRCRSAQVRCGQVRDGQMQRCSSQDVASPSPASCRKVRRLYWHLLKSYEPTLRPASKSSVVDARMSHFAEGTLRKGWLLRLDSNQQPSG